MEWFFTVTGFVGGVMGNMSRMARSCATCVYMHKTDKIGMTLQSACT